MTRTGPRRRSAIVTVAVAAALALTVTRPASAGEDHRHRGRQVIDITGDWKFALANPEAIEVPPGFAEAHLPRYDDSGWRTLDVPHDWSIELDPTAGPGTSAGTGFLQGGLGFYRKRFALSHREAGERISIEFDGVYMNSEIYVNGQLVGTHPYGYTGFAFDISGVVHTDGTPNLVAVTVQNRLPSSRWYSGSGIYRNVRLVVTESVHGARWGTFVTTPEVATTIGEGYADVHVATDVVNEGLEPSDLEVTRTIRDRRGRVVARSRSSLVVDPGTSRDTAVLRVHDPALWSIGAPAVYTLETRLSAGRERQGRSKPVRAVRWGRGS